MHSVQHFFRLYRPLGRIYQSQLVLKNYYSCYLCFWRKGRAAKLTPGWAQEDTALFCFVLVSECLILGSTVVVFFPALMLK